jgi:rhombotail lipoprotein
MRHRIALLLTLLPLLVLETACIGSRPSTRRINSALDFLYPQGIVTAQPASEVVLRLPVRVGLSFAPSQNHQADPITEEQKQRLLNRVAAAFRAHEGIGHLEVIPSTYFQAGGSFGNLEQIRQVLGVDLIVLLSYDQAQFTESTRASWTYLTVIGPLLIEGDRNDTRTLMDAVVFDIRSRVLLFRAAGESTVKGWSSPYNVSKKRRKHAAEGFEKATDPLIANLNAALSRFEEQARDGTVYGPGTAPVALYNRQGERITRSSGSGRGGGGALGAPELIAAALLGLALFLGRRGSPRGA